MQITRQLRRAAKRAANKVARKKAHAEFRPQNQRMNPLRQKLLHGLSVAIAESMEPTKAFAKMSDIAAYKVEQMYLASELNKEFIERSRGKGGKSPARKQFIKSVAFAANRTNPIGHFA